MQTIAIPMITNDSDFEEASQHLETLVMAAPGTPERYEADALWLILDDYQRKHHGPPPDASPVEVVRWLMTERGLIAKDLVPIFGDATRISDFLHGRRDLSKKHIRGLVETYGIPMACLM
jgi:HTH-type transcriptional regulator/antitoxin HigA